VVGSAKKAENSRDYRAAIERWAIVREFHPAYPNLDQEILKLQNLLGHENPTQVVIQLDANQATPVVQEHTSVTATPARLEPEPIPERLTFDIPATIHSGVPRDTSRKAPDELTSKLRKTQLKLAVAAQNLQSSSEESPTTAKQPEPEPTVKPVVTTDDVKIPTAVENFRAKRRVQANALRAFPAIRDQSRRCFMALQRVSSTLWNRIQTGMTWVGLPETGFVRYALFFFPLIVVLAFIITPGPTRKQQAVPAVPLSQFEVSIRATPDGTQLVLNNGLRGTTRIAPRLNVGPYMLTASAPGYISQSTRFLVRPGMSHLEVALKPEPLAIRLNAKVDWGTVSVDHSSPVPLDAGSFELNDVQPGSHTLEFEAQMSKLRMNFEFRPGEPVSVGGVSGSTNVGALVTSSLNGKTRVSCTCTPTTVAVDGKMVNVSASGLELALSPGEHRFEVGSLNGREYRVVAGISPALTISILSAIPKMLVAADSRSKVDPNPETDLLEVRGLMAEKQYVAAESKLVRVLSTSPENEAALRIRKDLDTVRRLDPESWK
jgi:hypothetical protein